MLKVNVFEVGGSTVTKRAVKANSIIIADRSRVRGPLRGDDIRIGEKADVEAVYGKAIVLEEKCRCTLVHGVDVRIQPGCRVLGEVLFSGSLEAAEDVTFVVAPKKVDVLPVEFT
jgi:cytoskeletal protein CcmA (bactofilin family)